MNVAQCDRCRSKKDVQRITVLVGGHGARGRLGADLCRKCRDGMYDAYNILPVERRSFKPCLEK